MRGSVQSIETWLDSSHISPEHFYLDISDWQRFLDWLTADQLRRVAKLQEEESCVILQASLLRKYFGADARRDRQLANLGIQLSQSRTHPTEAHINEILRAYFSNSADARPQAELLAHVRHTYGNETVSVISQHRGFWRIPMVDSYFINPQRLKGTMDLPAQFDFLQDLRVHRDLARSIASVIDSDQYGHIMEIALIALRDHVRSRSGLGSDGRSLMEQAFQVSGSHIRLNPLTNTDPRGSQVNEQTGFRELYTGVYTGIRNPLTHEGTSSGFASTRYPDKSTLLKYLSFISLLFERADAPLP